jgi:hypothetical protein
MLKKNKNKKVTSKNKILFLNTVQNAMEEKEKFERK